MSWSAYVLDDEPLAVGRLVRQLTQTGLITVVGSSTSPREAKAFLDAHRVDVLFLDINMPGMNGFELLAQLPVSPWIVFTTAYDEFALRAFEVHALDYLLKPVAAVQLTRVLAKLTRVGVVAPHGTDVQKACQEIVRTLRASRQPDFPERIASRRGDRICFIDVVKVTHMFAEDKLTYAVADGRRYCLDSPLAELEQRLDPKRFIRIHRSTVVNARWVDEVHPGFGGGLELQLRDEARTRLLVSRSRASEVKARLGI